MSTPEKRNLAASPHLRAYPIYTVVAKKLEAMVLLGETNSRMKDSVALCMGDHKLRRNLVAIAVHLVASKSKALSRRGQGRAHAPAGTGRDLQARQDLDHFRI